MPFAGFLDFAHTTAEIQHEIEVSQEYQGQQEDDYGVLKRQVCEEVGDETAHKRRNDA